MSKNKNTEVFTTVQKVKQTFEDYFKTTRRRSFKQFYYDWHIDAMIAPFAEITDYFCTHFPDDPKQAMSTFSTEFAQQVKNYNVDNCRNSSLNFKNFAVTKDGRLAHLIKETESFSFQFRQFIYSFATKENHQKEFGNWPIKTNMPYSHLYGLQMASNIFAFINKNFDSIIKTVDSKSKAAFLADAYIRQSIATDYKYQAGYTYQGRRQTMEKVAQLRDTLHRQYKEDYQEYRQEKSSLQSSFTDTFQVETFQPSHFGTYTPNGFELEFYVPEEYGDYSKLIKYLKEKNGWKSIYTNNKDAKVYDDKNSAGVIMRDESLARYSKLAAVEYASKIMKSKTDEQDCLKIFDAFDTGYVNVHCSLHQHVSNQNLDLNGYKRLVKRMMHFEKAIVHNFAAPERHDGKLLYATYISHNLSQDEHRDYPLLCVMADMCQNKNELVEMSCFGRKYKTLNLVPDKTVEFRFMNAHFNKEFVSAFLQFNRDMVNSAANNEGTHINRCLANRYNWRKNRLCDHKTVIKPLSYFYEHTYDSYRPQKLIPARTIQGEHKYAQLVVQALNQTGKLGYINPALTNRVKESARVAAR